MTTRRGNLLLCAVTLLALAAFLVWRRACIRRPMVRVSLWDMMMQYLSDSGVVDMGDTEWVRMRL